VTPYNKIDELLVKGRNVANSSSAFTKMGISSKDLLIPSVMDSEMAVCSIAPTAVVMRGWSGAVLLFAVFIVLSESKDQHTAAQKRGQYAPTASNLQLELESDGPSITTFHTSVPLFGPGPEPEKVSGRGSIDKVQGVSRAPASGVGSSVIHCKGSVDVEVGANELRRSSIEPILLHH
jgi:hypothetical protein